jgi:hypothetical protein
MADETYAEQVFIDNANHRVARLIWGSVDYLALDIPTMTLAGISGNLRTELMSGFPLQWDIAGGVLSIRRDPGGAFEARLNHTRLTTLPVAPYEGSADRNSADHVRTYLSPIVPENTPLEYSSTDKGYHPSLLDDPASKRIRVVIVCALIIIAWARLTPGGWDGELFASPTVTIGPMPYEPNIGRSTQYFGGGTEPLRISYGAGFDQVQTTVEPTGRVVRITDGSVDAPSSSFTTWMIPIDLANTILRTAGEKTTNLERNGGGVGGSLYAAVSQGPYVYFESDGLDDSSNPLRVEARTVVESMLKELETNATTDPTPWIPDEIAALIGAPSPIERFPGRGAPIAWPLQTHIADLVGAESANAYGEPGTCVMLTGDDVKRIWSYVDGRNTAYFEVEDNGTQYELQLNIGWPTYPASCR